MIGDRRSKTIDQRSIDIDASITAEHRRSPIGVTAGPAVLFDVQWCDAFRSSIDRYQCIDSSLLFEVRSQIIDLR
jgi:hypothetical protein